MPLDLGRLQGLQRASYLLRVPLKKQIDEARMKGNPELEIALKGIRSDMRKPGWKLTPENMVAYSDLLAAGVKTRQDYDALHTSIVRAMGLVIHHHFNRTTSGEERKVWRVVKHQYEKRKIRKDPLSKMVGLEERKPDFGGAVYAGLDEDAMKRFKESIEQLYFPLLPPEEKIRVTTQESDEELRKRVLQELEEVRDLKQTLRQQPVQEIKEHEEKWGARKHQVYANTAVLEFFVKPLTQISDMCREVELQAGRERAKRFRLP